MFGPFGRHTETLYGADTPLCRYSYAKTLENADTPLCCYADALFFWITNVLILLYSIKIQHNTYIILYDIYIIYLIHVIYIYNTCNICVI